MGALYTVGSSMFWGGFRALGLDVRPIDHHNIPSSGPAVIASNHIGYLDFALVVLAPPKPRREVRFLARAEFFDKPVVGGLMHKLGQIPVDVHGDPMQAAEVARKELERGELIGMHPEGTISPSFVPRRAKSGAVRLADSAGAPIVPVAVWGSQRILTKGGSFNATRGAVITVTFGPPVPYEPDEDPAEVSDRLMTAIGELVDEAQRTYPQAPAGPDDEWWLPAHLGGSAPTPEEAERRAREEAARRRERFERGSGQ